MMSWVWGPVRLADVTLYVLFVSMYCLASPLGSFGFSQAGTGFASSLCSKFAELRRKASMSISIRELDADTKNMKIIKQETVESEPLGTLISTWTCSHHGLNKIVKTAAHTCGRGIIDGLTAFSKLIRSSHGFWGRFCLAIKVLIRRDLRVIRTSPPQSTAGQRQLVVDYFVASLRVRRGFKDRVHHRGSHDFRGRFCQATCEGGRRPLVRVAGCHF
jgi:hypothetical protein